MNSMLEEWDFVLSLFFSSRRRHTRYWRDWSSDVCSSDLMFEFIQGKNMEKSVELARDIQNSVCRGVGRIDKGVHQAGFLVLRETSMPSCLIELGFITSAEEENFLNSSDGIRQMGQAIFQGFLRYKNKYFNGIVVPYKTERTETTTVPQLIKPHETTQPAAVDQPANADQKSESGVAQSRPTRSVPQQHENAQQTDAAKPVFKVQILSSSRKLRPTDEHFKKLEPVECYEEGGLNKYTYGASTNYNEVYRLRKEILDRFPEAFIVAFKNGERMNINAAIVEFKKNR